MELQRHSSKTLKGRVLTGSACEAGKCEVRSMAQALDLSDTLNIVAQRPEQRSW